MPTFDVVSEIDAHELVNAVDQMNREISNRYDFKGADAKIELKEKEKLLNVEAASEFQVQQIEDIIYSKLAKRNIDTRCLDKGKIEERGKRAYQTITVKQGIDKELGKKLIKLVKDAKLKVQATIQGEQVRVSGKNRDDLQDCIAMFRKSEVELPLQYTNFRD